MAAAGSTTVNIEVIIGSVGSALVSSHITTPTWSSMDDLLLIQSQNSTELAKLKKTRYAAIDVEKTMVELVECADLLRAALTAAGKLPCSVQIVHVGSGYQDLVANSTVATSTFIQTCLQALKYHKMAMKALQMQKVDAAIKAFGKCGDLADQMANVAHGLVTETDNLIKKSEDALLKAIGDKSEAENEKTRLQQKRVEEEAEEAAWTERKRETAQQLSELQQKAKEYSSEASSTRTKTNALKMILTGVLTVACPPVGIICGVASLFTNDGSQESAAAAAAQEEQVAKLMEEQRNTVQQLAASAARLATAVEEGTENEKMIGALKMCCLTLGRIKTRFVHMRQFWVNVAEHAKYLVRCKDDLLAALDIEDNDMINECYIESGKGWACLGLVSLEANKALVVTQAKVDSFMSSLPSGDASAAEVASMLQRLKASMDEQVRQVNVEMEDFQEFMQAQKGSPEVS